MKQRVYYFDNAKFILIAIVILGHLLRTFIKNDVIIDTLYKVIYTFHMPAFILISGFFAKGFRKEGYIKKTAKRFLLPYLLFQLIYSIFYYFLEQQQTFTFDPFRPHWSLWFLISMFCWNMMLFAFTRMPAVLSILLATLIGLAAGYVEFISNYLSLSRTLVFFPLFLLGYYLKKEHFYRLFDWKIKLSAIGLFLLAFTVIYLLPDFQFEWLFGSKSYAELGKVTITAMFIRLGVYLLSLVMMASFFALIPRKEYFFTSLGRYSLYVYLLHGFFIQLFRASEFKYYFANSESILVLAVISFLLTWLLSSRIVIALTQPFIELKISRMQEMTKKLVSAIRSSRKKHLDDNE